VKLVLSCGTCGTSKIPQRIPPRSGHYFKVSLVLGPLMSGPSRVESVWVWCGISLSFAMNMKLGHVVKNVEFRSLVSGEMLPK